MEFYVLRFGKNYYSTYVSEFGSVKVILVPTLQMAQWLNKGEVTRISEEIGGEAVLTRVIEGGFE